MAEQGSSVAKKEQVSDAVKTLRNRKVYLSIRLPQLRQEVKAVGDQKKRAAEKLKAAESLSADQQKKLREERIYAVHHHEALRAELKALTAERQQVLQKLRA